MLHVGNFDSGEDRITPWGNGVGLPRFSATRRSRDRSYLPIPTIGTPNDNSQQTSRKGQDPSPTSSFSSIARKNVDEYYPHTPRSNR
jgi:hypothetical protein